MKNMTKTITTTLVLTGAFMFGGQVKAATKTSNSHAIATQKQYNKNLRSIRQYQKAAINFGDSKTFNAGNKAWKYVIKDYAHDMYSTKFDIPAQEYLMRYRLYFQRDTNPYYLNKQNKNY